MLNCITCQFSHAQQFKHEFSMTDWVNIVGNDHRDVGLMAKTKGSVYINESFLPVKLTGYGDVLFQGRFDAYNGVMEVIPHNQERPIVLNMENEKFEVYFTSLGKTYINYSYLDNGKNKTEFFIPLVNSERFSLLKQESVAYVEGVKAQTSFQVDRPAYFKRLKDSYFIQTEEGGIIALPKNKKQLAKLFVGQEKEVHSYITKQKINTMEEGDMIKLFTHVNTL